MNQKTEGKPAKISLKKYLRELKYLHGELVALQRWVLMTIYYTFHLS